MISLIIAITTTAIVYRWRFFHLQEIPKTWIVGAWSIKLIAGLILWWTYTHHYTGKDTSDAIRYYDDAILIRDQLHKQPEVFVTLMTGRSDSSQAYLEVYDKLVGWHDAYRYGLTNDYRTIVRLNVALTFISWGDYHVHWMAMAWLSFMGLMWIFKSLVPAFQEKKRWLFGAIFFIPSVVFWSSGLLKEGPTLFGVGLLLHGLAKWYHHQSRWYDWLGISIAVILLLHLKEYILLAMIPAGISLIVVRLFKSRPGLTFILTHAACFMLAQQAHHFFIGGDFLYVLNKKRVDFENTALLQHAESVVHVPETGTTATFLVHYPEAFALTYLRPFPWELHKWLYIPFGIENMVLAMALLCAILFRAQPKKSQDRTMIWFTLGFSLVMAAIIGNCVNVLGSIVRYKIIALPFLSATLVYWIDMDRLRRLFDRTHARP